MHHLHIRPVAQTRRRGFTAWFVLVSSGEFRQTPLSVQTPQTSFHSTTWAANTSPIYNLFDNPFNTCVTKSHSVPYDVEFPIMDSHLDLPR